MHDAKGMPEDDVGVDDGRVWCSGDPGGDAGAGFAGGLRDVAAGGVEGVVGICVNIS